MTQPSIKRTFLTVLGSGYILIGIVCNEWTLTWLASSDNQISPLTRTLIWSFDLILISLGILTLLYRHRDHIINMNLLFFSFGFVLFLGELYLRFFYVDPYMSLHSNSLIRIPDNELHHTLKPNVRAVNPWGDRAPVYYTNSLGFRDKGRRTVQKTTESDYRIIVLGDSFTESVGVEWSDAFIFKLEQHYKNDGFNSEFLNGGVASLSPGLLLRKLQRFLRQGYTTDEVILMLDISDIEDESVIYMDWQAHQEQYKENRTNALTPWMISFIRSRINQLFTDDPPSTALPNRPSLSDRVIDTGKEPRKSPRGLWTESDSIYQAWGARGVQKCQEKIIEIQSLCKQYDIKFSMAIYPWPQQLMSPKRPSLHQALFTKFAAENVLMLHDLFPVFYALENWEDYYIPGDTHWNEKGHTLAAQALYATIKSR